MNPTGGLALPSSLQVKLTSRDPSPPPVEYVRGGGGIFKDMAVHDLDMSRFLMGSEPRVRHELGGGGRKACLGSRPLVLELGLWKPL